jgi:hypothetical protein
MFTYDLINVKTGEVREDLKASTIGELLGLNSKEINNYARGGWTYGETYKMVVNRKVAYDMVNAFPKELLEEWDKVTSKFRRYYSNERVSQYTKN